MRWVEVFNACWADISLNPKEVSEAAKAADQLMKLRCKKCKGMGSGFEEKEWDNEFQTYITPACRACNGSGWDVDRD